MRFSAKTFSVAVLTATLLSGCVGGKKEEVLPVTQWDHRPEAEVWTETALEAVAEKDPVFAEQVPQDIEDWCPAYETASIDDRRAFWVGLLSATAKHESTWNPQASGGGGKWIGLMQIDPRSARYYECDATSPDALKDGAANLDCAVDILAVQVEKDNLVAGEGNRGIGRDWAPFRSAEKRQDMSEWTRSAPYCQA